MDPKWRWWLAMAAVLACVIIGSQAGAWLGYAIGTAMH